MKRVFAIAAVVAASVAGALALGASGGGDDAKTYDIVLDNAFGLANGGDFKVAGVRVGRDGWPAQPQSDAVSQFDDLGHLTELLDDAGEHVRPPPV